MGELRRSDIYSVIMDYRKSAEDLLRIGQYWSINPIIRERRFEQELVDKIKVIDMQIIEGMPWTRENDDVVPYLLQLGVRPATLSEVLTLDIKLYPNLLDNLYAKNVLALGSPWKNHFGDVVVPGLAGFRNVRRVCLYSDRQTSFALQRLAVVLL